jgi:radical SAM protein with 4Fe4S-binding SPASM domain
MDVGLFKEKIIDYIVNNPQYSFGLINLWQGGEVLLHPKFEEMLYIVGSARKKYKKFPQVNFLTNGMLLDEKKSNIIFASEAVDEIYFSVDGGNKKDFENMRCGAKWETVLKNIDNFINLNNKRDRKVTTGIFSIISLDKQDCAPDFLNLVNKIDYFHPRPPHNWDGNFSLNLGEYKSMEFIPKKGLCGRVTNTMAILWNGKVVPCCQDLTGRGVIGDLNKQTLFTIFDSATRKQYIDLMREGNRAQIELCKNCSL